MKVFIQAYNTCYQNKSGGVQIRIKKYYEAISKNCDVSFFNAFNSDLRECDILHVFKLDIENLALIRCAKSMGKKVVLSSIVNCVNAKRIDFYRVISKLPFATTYRCLFEIVKLCDLIIVESKQEKDFLCQHFGAVEEQLCIIGNGAEDYSDADSSIYEKIGTSKDYVLQVGRFDENKNQLNVIKALKKSGLPIVFIGGADISDKGYYNQCIQEAVEDLNFHFLGWVDNKSPLLASAYAHAKVLLAPSFSETFGLTIIEGAIAGAVPVLSKTLPILEDKHFKECITCNPNNLQDIKKATLEAYNKDRDCEFRKRIKAEFSWDSIAKQHMDKYSELIR